MRRALGTPDRVAAVSTHQEVLWTDKIIGPSADLEATKLAYPGLTCTGGPPPHHIDEVVCSFSTPVGGKDAATYVAIKTYVTFPSPHAPTSDVVMSSLPR